VLHCAVVESVPGGTKLEVYEVNVGELRVRPKPGLDPLPDATRFHGVALTGSDLYVVADVGGREGLYAISITDKGASWDEINPGKTDCRRSIGTACADLLKSVKGGPIMAGLRLRATMTAFQGRAWCAYDTGLVGNNLYWQTYAAKSWSPPYQFGNMVCGSDPAMCLYGDALYCFHRGEDGEQVRWSATEGLTWSVAHDTPMRTISAPAVRAFRGKIYCAYVNWSAVPEGPPAADDDAEVWPAVGHG
jgi:hypothetical protein